MKTMTKNQYCEEYNKVVDIFNEHIGQFNDEFDAKYPEIEDVWDGPNWVTYREFMAEKIDPLIEHLNFKTDDELNFEVIEAVKLI